MYNNTGAGQSTTTDTKFTLEARMRRSAAGGNSLQFPVYTFPAQATTWTGANSVANIIFAQTIVTQGGGTGAPDFLDVYPYSPGTWYTVVVYVDTDAQKTEFWVDGVYAATHTPRNTGSKTINYFIVGTNDSTDDLDIDYIRIYKGKRWTIAE
jgi:hypothetical protein